MAARISTSCSSLVVAVLVAGALAGGCTTRAGASPQPSLASAHPLALMAPGGTAQVDRLISELQGKVRRAPVSPGPWVQLGHAWARKAREVSDPGLYRSAGECADAALALVPEHRGALGLRGLVLLDAHRFGEARALGEQMLARDRDDLTALAVVADAELELGRFEHALGTAQRMLDLKPSLPSYARASHLRWLRGDVAGALELARLAIDAGGDAEPRAWMLVQTALMFWHRGDLAGADAGLDQALATVPGYAPAVAAKGRVALSRGDARAAVHHLERAFARAPLPETAWLLGDAREALGGDEEGAHVAQAHVMQVGRAFDRRTLALFLATKGRDADEAVRLAERERTIRDDVYTEDAYAWALHRAGRRAEARVASDRALALGTPDARLLFHAGAIRLASGDRHGGRQLVAQALRFNPEFDRTGAAEARRLLATPDPRASR